MGDWLGTGTVREYRSFKKARAFVRRLSLRSGVKWREYCKSGKKPADIPADPSAVYADAGWAGLGDWLGTGTVAPRLREYRSFKEARTLVRRLGLKSFREWTKYITSKKMPADFPKSPEAVYQSIGWADWGDWLGTGKIATYHRKYRTFKVARAYVRCLGLKSFDQWRDYCRSGEKPDDIPAGPSRTYANSGWAGWGDWLGTGTISLGSRRYWPFKKARAFARRLGLKSTAEWNAYCKSGKKQADIPATPARIYVNAGWSGLGDWLGTGILRGTGWRAFREARAFVRRLHLKSEKEWREYCKSGRPLRTN